MSKIFSIKANSLEEAMGLAREETDIDNGDYVDGSFEVDCDATEEYNKNVDE